MAGTKGWAIFLVVLCTFFTSFGTLLVKKGVDRLAFTAQGMLSAYPILIGLFLYFLGFILLIIAFRHGELSVLYPFVSLSFIWVAALSYFLLGESIGLLKMLGVSIIVAGVAIIGLSSRNGRTDARVRA